MNKTIPGKWGQKIKKYKEAGVTILITDKVEFKSKSVKHDKAGHLLMVNVTNHNESITCMRIYSPDNTAVTLWSKICQQMQGDMSRITVVLGDINITLSVQDTSSGLNLSKEIEDLQNKPIR